ncbi:MAG: ATP-grasp domain-containing protein [Thermodesulfobacteriota bacterium]
MRDRNHAEDKPEPDAVPDRRLGILGGGQLAKMLAEAALRQGLQPVILVGSAADPAAIDGAELIFGGLEEPAALSKVAARAGVLTIENEFLDLGLLGEVLDRHPSVQLRPGVESIAAAQDKLAQRRLFRGLDIAMPEYCPLHSASLPRDLTQVRKRFPEGFVLKWSRFGYDGRGNLAVTPGQKVNPKEIADFCRRGEDRGATIYAERRVDFDCELAMVSTRAADGDQVYFPLVISRQERGVCREVVGPAEAGGYDLDLERQARAIMRKIAEELDLAGTFAVEFFLERDGRLLVNEMAPRVHNSGHYTLFDPEPSQFDLHVQAVAGIPLSQPALQGIGVMRNFLGPWDIRPGTPCTAPAEAPPAGTSLEWYGKQLVSPGRKMGHLSGRAPSFEAATDLLQAMAAYEDRFWDNLQEATIKEVRR